MIVEPQSNTSAVFAWYFEKLKPIIQVVKSRCFSIILVFLCLGIGPAVYGQNTEQLSLKKALEIALKNNKEIEAAKLNIDIAKENVRQIKNQALPDVDLHTSYARITNIDEFRNGLGNPVTFHTIPGIADLTAHAAMPIYAGGEIRNSIKKARQEASIAAFQTEKTENDIRLNVTGTFLGVFKLMELQELIQENIKEESNRLKEVKAFKAHGTVTENEVLRAELQLADRQLALLSNQKNIEIKLHELKTLLQLPEDAPLAIDTAGILQNIPATQVYNYYQDASSRKEEMRIASQKEIISLTEKELLKSGNRPKVSLFSSYGLNYPDYLFFPPNPYWYTLGKVGVEASFSVSELFKNKTRLRMADIKIAAQKVETEVLQNKISDRVFNQYKQYQEIEDRLPVDRKSEAQAKENYRIVKLKYFNQLALITEMVDADNLMLQAKFNTISTRIDAIMKYYELLDASGLWQKMY